MMATSSLIDQVAAAFEHQDYKTAARLLVRLLKEFPEDPWVQFYAGRLQEVAGKRQAAAAIYFKLLQNTTIAKIALQTKQGLQRLEDEARSRRQEAIAQATGDPLNAGLGFLVLEPLKHELRQAAAPKFAQIMKLDAYTARLHLPVRGWRLYRTGAIGELQLYEQELREASIPAFCTSLAEIQKIRIFRIHYLRTGSPGAVVVCQNESDQLGSLAFDWSEVSQRVEGLLPIFEDVIDLDARNRLKRKEQTQDYARLCDLHLPGRNCILRFCDSSYQFQRGINFDRRQNDTTSLVQTTVRIKWNNLIHFLGDRLPQVPLWSDFNPFVETALEHLEFVNGLKSHVDLFRKAETKWDSAFQLYSGLVFLRDTGAENHSSSR